MNTSLKSLLSGILLTTALGGLQIPAVQASDDDRSYNKRGHYQEGHKHRGKRHHVGHKRHGHGHHRPHHRPHHGHHRPHHKPHHGHHRPHHGHHKPHHRPYWKPGYYNPYSSYGLHYGDGHYGFSIYYRD